MGSAGCTSCSASCCKQESQETSLSQTFIINKNNSSNLSLMNNMDVNNAKNYNYINIKTTMKTAKELDEEYTSQKDIENKKLESLFIKNIIFLQSIFKGYIYRKKNKNRKKKSSDSLNSFVSNHLNNFHRQSERKINKLENYNLSSPMEYNDNIRRPFNKILIKATEHKQIIDNDKDFNEFSNFNNSLEKFYEGEWINSKFDGFGVITWKNGSKFRGYFKNGVSCGIGSFNHHNKDIFIGEWLNDRVCGLGIFISHKGNNYKGEWKNDKQNGFGIEEWAGGKYFGEYSNGVKSGYGVLYLKDGSIFEGEFKNNQINGLGKIEFSDGRQYKGYWVDNKISGFGVMIWNERNEIKSYEGEFYNEMKHGFGIYKKDKKTYLGVWRMNNLEGEVLIVETIINYSQGTTGLDMKISYKNTLWEDGKKVKTLDKPSSYINLAKEIGIIY